MGMPHLLRNAWKPGQTAWRCPRRSFLLPLQPPGPSHSRVHLPSLPPPGVPLLSVPFLQEAFLDC